MSRPVREGLSRPVREGLSRPVREGLSRPRREGLSRPRREGLSRPRREGLSRPRREGLSRPVREGLSRPRREDVFPCRGRPSSGLPHRSRTAHAYMRPWIFRLHDAGRPRGGVPSPTENREPRRDRPLCLPVPAVRQGTTTGGRSDTQVADIYVRPYKPVNPTEKGDDARPAAPDPGVDRFFTFG